MLRVAEHCSSRDIASKVRSGRIVKFDARSILPPNLSDLSIDEWDQRFGKRSVNYHVLRPAFERRLRDIVGDHKGSNVVDFHKVKDTLDPMNMIESAPTTLGRVLAEIRQRGDRKYESEFFDNVHTREKTLDYIDKFRTYAVANARRFPELKFEFPVEFDAWSAIFNFIWFGLSPGGTHLDVYDNTLIQIRGRKQVLIFPPEFVLAIDGGPYVTKFDGLHPLGEQTLNEHPYLKHIPYYIVDLEPGEGVAIPACAYHAPVALTSDSISLNSFLLPKLRGGPLPLIGKVVPDAIWFKMKLSRWLFNLTGLIGHRNGPYEFV